MNKSEAHLQEYEKELSYLRRAGVEFAKKYPKIAARLELDTGQSPDPHVERLIESFAFLAADLKIKMKREFLNFGMTMLDILYPHLANPIPSMSVARFMVDPSRGKFDKGFPIPKDTPLYAETGTGEPCRFMTCYPVTLWPLEVDFADYEPNWKYKKVRLAADAHTVLRIRVASLSSASISTLQLNKLRFFIRGERSAAFSLYEQIYADGTIAAVLQDSSDEIEILPGNAISEVGFSSEENALPDSRAGNPGHRLIQEYFAFPDKFLFFDIGALDLSRSNKYFDLLFFLKSRPGKGFHVDKNNFCLGCTPIINLFRQVTEPIRLDEKSMEYRLVPDSHREKYTDIYSIIAISELSAPGADSRLIAPFFASHHRGKTDHTGSYWIARRRDDTPCADIYLSFVNPDMNPRLPPTKIVYAETYCTNRKLAEEIPNGTLLQIEKSVPASRIEIIVKPTERVASVSSGRALWMLISNLSINHLPMGGGRQGLESLKEVLAIYDSPQKSTMLIRGIADMEVGRTISRIGEDAWRGFCIGQGITFTFDEDYFVGSSALMLAAVLNRFLPQYASINSFTQVGVKSYQKNGIWKKWPPMIGNRFLL